MSGASKLVSLREAVAAHVTPSASVLLGAHASSVQGYYGRDHAFFTQYHGQSRTREDFERWLARWVMGVADRRGYRTMLGACRVGALSVKEHAYAAPADFGY
jgi:glutaconate CoA-transferase subunit A